MENEEEVKLTECGNRLGYAQIVHMPKVYFKISREYIQENLGNLMRSLADTTSSYIHTDAVYLTFFKKLKRENQVECAVNGYMVEMRLVNIEEDDDVENEAFLIFQAAEHDRRMRQEKILAKYLSESPYNLTFTATISPRLFKAIQEAT